MNASRTHVPDSENEIARERPLKRRVVAHHVGRVEIEFHGIQSRGSLSRAVERVRIGRARDGANRHKRRLYPCSVSKDVLPDGIKIHSEAGSHDGSIGAPHVPRESNARRQVAPRRIVEQRIPHRRCLIVAVAQIRQLAVRFSRDREGIVPKAVTHGENRRPPELIVDVQAEKVLAIATRIRRTCASKAVDSLSGVVSTPAAAGVVDQLVDAWRATTVSAEELALMLLAAVHVLIKAANQQSTELVWTGPTTPFVSARRTEQALLQVINAAERTLFITSFVAYDVSSIVKALNAASERGVLISMLLELSQDHGGSIVNMASVNGLVAQPRRAAYATAKAGLIMLTRVESGDGSADHARLSANWPRSVLSASGTPDSLLSRRAISSKTSGRGPNLLSSLARIASTTVVVWSTTVRRLTT